LSGISRVIKVNSEGRLQWDQSMDRVNDLREPYGVEIKDLENTRDGGYIVCGFARLSGLGRPAVGCVEVPWVAKLSQEVSHAGEVVSWKTAADTILESTEKLNGEWINQSEALSLGAATAVSIVPAGHQRYYRLRGTGSPEDVPRLSFGALLSWPVDQNKILEFSSVKDGAWVNYVGQQGMIGNTNYAIVPQSLRAHYFRARKKE
jgi:hypothetical protein